MRIPFLPHALLALSLSGCVVIEATDPDHQATSLLGSELMRPPLDSERESELEANLAAAERAWRAEHSEENGIWVGRRMAYLGQYRQAADWYTWRLREMPDSFKLLRHRGHRYITLRRFEDAEADLERAWELCAHLRDEVEPDGAPNRYNVPRSTTHTNILYHLALARYLQADYEGAIDAWGACLERCANDDMRVATLNWLVASLRRAGRFDESRTVLADVHMRMDVMENFSYHRLLFLYRGDQRPDWVTRINDGDALQGGTLGYGIANWAWMNGSEAQATDAMREIVANGPWAAFGVIAAEADLARL